jgi:hypothetical protein
VGVERDSKDNQWPDRPSSPLVCPQGPLLSSHRGPCVHGQCMWSTALVFPREYTRCGGLGETGLYYGVCPCKLTIPVSCHIMGQLNYASLDS